MTLKISFQRIFQHSPIIREGKIGDAAAVLELATIKNTDDFQTAYRALTEDPTPLPEVTTALTPLQAPYLPRLDAYSALMPSSLMQPSSSSSPSLMLSLASQGGDKT